MKCIILGGFLGSGKTTVIRKLVELLDKRGERIAIIVNEIGEIGIDGDTISAGGVETREITSGCICCTLQVNLEHTLKSLMEEYEPDVVIMEPTGIAFPRQIKSNIASMKIPGLILAPVANLVDASRLDPEAGVQNFMRNQIEDAEVLCINKADLAGREELLKLYDYLRQLNPKAIMMHFSARQDKEKLEILLETLLEEESENRTLNMVQNSVNASGVSAYSSEFELEDSGIGREEAASIARQLLENIKEKTGTLNPKFTGHIKLSFRQPGTLIKGSVTSASGSPELEILETARDSGSKMKVFSAVTDVTQAALTEAIETAVCEQFEKSRLEARKIWTPRPHTHG